MEYKLILKELEKNYGWINTKEFTKMQKELVNDVAKIISSQIEPPINNAKIWWFMELALKMREDGYSDADIYSIDIGAWDDYRTDEGLTPTESLAEEERNR